MTKICVEYIWYDDNQNYRSKCKVLDMLVQDVSELPDWNFDGSSTGQSINENNTEVILKPVALFNDPFRGRNNKLVLCDCYYDNNTPTKENYRYNANKIFQQKMELEPWFGMEQEYFMIDNNTGDPCGFSDVKEQGNHYCGVGDNINAVSRCFMELHLKFCIRAGVKISGINVEVAPGQGEFQVGPCTGIEAGDHLHMARYLLYRLSEYYNISIELHPKPLDDTTWNGSGCHTNFSTIKMRNGTKNKTGYKHIKTAIKKLGKKHDYHMMFYGTDNELRMSGKCETASYNEFSWSVGGRDVSVRVGNETHENKCGYFEDRRPASNCEPYLVTSLIYETCCL